MTMKDILNHLGPESLLHLSLSPHHISHNPHHCIYTTPIIYATTTSICTTYLHYATSLLPPLHLQSLTAERLPPPWYCRTAGAHHSAQISPTHPLLTTNYPPSMRVGPSLFWNSDLAICSRNITNIWNSYNERCNFRSNFDQNLAQFEISRLWFFFIWKISHKMDFIITLVCLSWICPHVSGIVSPGAPPMC